MKVMTRAEKQGLSKDNLKKYFLMAPILVWIAGTIITSQFPAVIDVRHQDSSLGFSGEYRSVKHKVTARKVLNCVLIKRSEAGYAWNESRKFWQEVPFYFRGDVSPGSSKPDQWALQSFGYWEWKIPLDGEAYTDLKTTVIHNCHGDLRVTTVGDFPSKTSEEPTEFVLDESLRFPQY